MELDDLKILFKEKLSTQQPQKSAEEISLLLGKKMQSVIAKLKRSLWIEFIACIVFTLICGAVAVFAKYSSIQIYFSIFTVLCFLFLPLLWFLLQKTKRLSSSVLPVKTNLESVVKILKEYVRRYFQLTMALIPVTLIIIFLLGYNNGDPDLRDPFFLALKGSTKQVIYIAYVIVFSVGMYYFTKWYLKKLYGNYIDQLQQFIKELEE